MLFATVRQRKIHVKKPDTVIQNGVNVDWLKLEMDDEWAEMDSIVCVFVNQYTEEVSGKLEKKEVSRQMLHTFGKEVRVPWECLEKTGTLSVSCTGYVDGEKVMTTMYPDSYWNVVQNGPVTGDETIEPTASLYEQILAAAGEAKAAAIAANEAKDQLLQDAANGVFDGADGKNAKVSVGSTQTGNPGSEAEVYSTGTDQDLKLNFVIPRGDKGEPGYTPVKGKDYFDGKDGKDGQDGQPGKDGYTPVKGVDYFDGKDGKDGVRGCSILKIMTAPSSYTTTTGGFEPTYRVALSNVTSQSRVSEVLVGDVISYLYYLYPVGYVDDAYVYLGARTSIRGIAGEDGKDGKNGKDGKSITISNVYTTTIDGGVNTVTFSDGTYLRVTNGRKGSAGRNGTDGKDGVTPVFSIGTVETLEPGTNASASITGTAENPVLNLGIPKGMPGEGGSGGGDTAGAAIIDVTELPTENIREDAFYRLVTASFLYGQYIKNDWTMYTVENLPQTGEMCWDGTTAVAYYSVSDNDTYGYVDANVSAAMGVPVGWYPASVLIPAVGKPYGGVITDLTQAVDGTVYTFLQNVLHSYKDGVWSKVEVIGWRGTGESAEVFNRMSNIASGSCSHAEGNRTTASGNSSHAEGNRTTASGNSSHAEGNRTTASGNYSHAEGLGTIAGGDYQHTHGRFNVVDTESKYAHIVGNGAGDLVQSNAHTLDWDGNAWFQGDVYVGGTGQGDPNAKKLATEEFVNFKKSEIVAEVLAALPAAEEATF